MVVRINYVFFFGRCLHFMATAPQNNTTFPHTHTIAICKQLTRTYLLQCRKTLGQDDRMANM